MNRAQHIVPSGIVAMVGLWVAYVSFTAQPAEAFLFPRLIASVFVVLSLWTFAKALMGLSKNGVGVSWELMRNMVPGLVIALVYVFWMAKGLGFYTATALACFACLTAYDPAPHGALKSWVKRALITAGFIAVMYGLFALLLKVYTPKEVFF